MDVLPTEVQSVWCMLLFAYAKAALASHKPRLSSLIGCNFDCKIRPFSDRCMHGACVASLLYLARCHCTSINTSVHQLMPGMSESYALIMPSHQLNKHHHNRRCVVFEDAPMGFQAAQRAGAMKVVDVTSLPGHPERDERHG